MAKFINGGAVELFYNGTKKFETTSTGVKFIGTLKADDNQSILLGSSDDFRIRHTGSHSEITDEGTGSLRLGSNEIILGSADFGETSAKFTDDGSVELYHDNVKKFETTSAGATVTGNLTVSADLIINGTTTTVNSTTVTIDDPVFTLGGDSAPDSDDNKDRGIEFRYHNGSAAKIGFFGWDDSASVFTFIADASPLSEVYSGSAGNVAFGNIAGTLTTAAQSNITSLGTLTTLTVDDITINGSTISDAGAFSLDVGADITFDAGGGDIILSDDGTIVGTLSMNQNGGDFDVRARVSDKDLVFKGNDGGSEITALRLDMSDAGSAIFNHNIALPSGGELDWDGGDAKFVHSSNTLTLTGGRLVITSGTGEAIKVTNSDIVNFDFSTVRGDQFRASSNSDQLEFRGGTNKTRFLNSDGGTELLALTDAGITSILAGGTSSPTGVNGLHLMFDSGSATSWIKSEQNGTSNRHLAFGASTYTFNYGATTFNAAITVGVDDTGYDVKFFGDTAGSFMLWDASQDRLELTDDSKIVFGDSIADASIWHNGTDTYIDNGTGDLVIRNQADDKDIIFKCDDGSGGTEAYFYLDGSASGGNPITIFPDMSFLTFGGGLDLQIVHTGSESTFTNYTGDLTFTQQAADKDIIFQSDDGSGGAETYFFLDGSYSSGSPITTFPDDSWLTFGTDRDLQIAHVGGTYSTISNYTGDVLFRQYHDDGDIIFSSDDGSGGLAEYFRLDGGDVQTKFTKNTKHFDSTIAYFGNAADLAVYHDGSNSFIINETGGLYITNRTDDGDIIFQSDDGSGGTETYMFMDGSQSSGNPVTVIPDNAYLSIGNALDFNLRHNGTTTLLINNTGNLKISQYADDSDIIFECDDGVAVELLNISV